MFILDSYSILCLFDRKRHKEGSVIKKYMEDAEKGKIELYVSKINEGEIFYKLYKYLGEAVAFGFRKDIKNGIIPVNIVSVNDKRVEKASEIKAKYQVSYADAFCIEVARDMNLPIITGDREFKDVSEAIKVVWLDNLVTG